jgi:hypothetical protein
MENELSNVGLVAVSALDKVVGTDGELLDACALDDVT